MVKTYSLFDKAFHDCTSVSVANSDNTPRSNPVVTSCHLFITITAAKFTTVPLTWAHKTYTELQYSDIRAYKKHLCHMNMRYSDKPDIEVYEVLSISNCTRRYKTLSMRNNDISQIENVLKIVLIACLDAWCLAKWQNQMYSREMQ